MLDASPSASFVVESDGVIRYANHAAKLHWDRCDFLVGNGSSLSNYLSFTPAAPLDHGDQVSRCSSWEDVIEPNSFIDDIKTVHGIGIRQNLGFYSATITLARINVEEIRSDARTSPDRNGNSLVDQYLYCLYIHDTAEQIPQRNAPDIDCSHIWPQNQIDEPSNNFEVNSSSIQENGTLPEGHGTSYQRQSVNHHDITLAALDSFFHALFVINDQCVIQTVNAKSSKVFGWTQKEFIGQSMKIIISHDFAAAHDNNVNDLFEKGIKNMIGKERKINARRKDGSTFPAALSLAYTNGRESSLICGFIRDLSTEIAAQELIVREQMLTSGIIDASFDGLFVISDQGIIQRVNKASCQVFGWSEEEFIGQNINMIMPKHHTEMHDSYLSQYLKTGIKRMIGKERELEACRKDGTTFPCTLGLAEVATNGPSRFVGFVRDITFQKGALNAAKEEQARISKILDASYDSLLVINEKGIIQMVNEAATKTFGWTNQEFIGRNINIIMPPLHAAKHDSYIQKYLATGFKKMIGSIDLIGSKNKHSSSKAK